MRFPFRFYGRYPTGGKFKKVGEVVKELHCTTGPGGELLFLKGEEVFRLRGLQKVADGVRPKKRTPKTPKKTAAKKSGTKKPAKPSLDPIGLDGVPRDEEIAKEAPPQIGMKFPSGSRALHAETGKRVVGLARKEGRGSFTRLFVYQGEGPAEERTDAFADIRTWYAEHISLARDGSSVDIGGAYQLWRLDLETGARDALWKRPLRPADLGKCVGLASIDADTSVVLCEQGICLMRKTDGEWIQIHRVKLAACAQLVYLPGPKLLGVRGTGTTRFTLLTPLRNKLKKLIDNKTFPISKMRAAHGLIFLNSRDEGWMVVGGEDAAAFEHARDKS